MKCEELYIWIENALEIKKGLLPERILEHINDCENCAEKITAMQQSFEYMEVQRKETLSEEKTNQIISELVILNSLNTSNNLNGRFLISRVAAVLIIAFGVLAGIVAGGMLFAESDSNEDPWSNEFTLLSENTEYILFE